MCFCVAFVLLVFLAVDANFVLISFVQSHCSSCCGKTGSIIQQVQGWRYVDRQKR